METPERRRSRRVRPLVAEPVRVELRCGEGRAPLILDAVDIAIHGIGLQAPADLLASLEPELGIDAEFSLPGQLERLGIPVEIRQRRELGELVHLGLEFAFEDAEQKDWASAHLASYVSGRLEGERPIGRAA